MLSHNKDFNRLLYLLSLCYAVRGTCISRWNESRFDTPKSPLTGSAVARWVLTNVSCQQRPGAGADEHVLTDVLPNRTILNALLVPLSERLRKRPFDWQSKQRTSRLIWLRKSLHFWRPFTEFVTQLSDNGLSRVFNGLDTSPFTRCCKECTRASTHCHRPDTISWLIQR